jgi:hypothetical protein
VTTMPEGQSVSEQANLGRNLWSLDEYIVVADLYLRRGRSSGVGDPDVVELAQLTGRSTASISRRLGNFDGTVRPGMGLKPVVGEPLAIFQSMQSDDAFRSRVVSEARARMRAVSRDNVLGPPGSGPQLVDPEAFAVEETEVTPSSVTRQMIRAEAQLVRRYRNWLDPLSTRLRGLIIPTADHLLRADLYDTKLDVLIEAKSDVSRESVRYAIGQLFDYRRYLDPRPALAILVPTELNSDLAALPGQAGIDVIWSVDDYFRDSADGRLTSGR